MRASWLDHRVRREAKSLAREARAAIGIKRGLSGKGGDLETVTHSVQSALQRGDNATVRRQLPVLDALVDELVKRPPKSTARDYVESIGAAVLIALALRAFVVEAFKIPSASMYPSLEIGDHIFVNKFIYGIRIPWTTTKLFELNGPHRGDVIVFIYPCNPERDYIKRVVALAGQTVEVRCSVVYVDGVAVPSALAEAKTSWMDFPEGAADWHKEFSSRYVETVGGKQYSTFHETERPEHERQLAAGTTSEGDQRDFPLRSGPPSCANAPDGAKGSRPQTLGTFVQTKPEGEAKVCEPHQHYVVPPGHIFAMGDNRNNSNDSRVWGSVPIENIKGKALFIWLSYEDFDLLHFWKTTPGLDGIRYSRIGNFVK